MLVKQNNHLFIHSLIYSFKYYFIYVYFSPPRIIGRSTSLAGSPHSLVGCFLLGLWLPTVLLCTTHHYTHIVMSVELVLRNEGWYHADACGYSNFGCGM